MCALLPIGVSEKTIRRIDCAVFEMDTPSNIKDNLGAISIDEKYLGSRLGFISTILDARHERAVSSRLQAGQ